jgi:hypothetical protein
VGGLVGWEDGEEYWCRSLETVAAKEVRRIWGELGGGLWDLSWGER